MKRAVLAMWMAAIAATPGHAQSTKTQKTTRPLSAIDWLSDSVTAPVTVALPKLSSPGLPPINEPATAKTAAIAEVTVMTLGETMADAVGLLPVSVTGLPNNLWGSTSAGDLARLVRAERADMVPSLQAFFKQLMIAELAAPVDSDARGLLFLARIDRLLDLGALEEAAALIDRAGITRSGEVFRRGFDVALLTGNENAACQALETAPELSPTYPTRVFCLARNGDWDAAALTLGTARALGFVTATEDALLSRFLDPDLFEGQPVPPPPSVITPLIFRIYEAIGEPLSTERMPRAFAHADLRDTAGWKAQIEAAERLARGDAVEDNRLIELYTERKPAASGGVWERVAAMQALDAALTARSPKATAAALPRAYAEMTAAELEPQLARFMSEPVAAMTLPPDAAALAFRLAMLTPEYERAALSARPTTEKDRFLAALARGRPELATAPDALSQAVADGFAATGAPVRVQSLLDRGRTGEAMLRALDLVSSGATGEVDELADGIALLRALGLESLARRAALEVLVLDRLG